MFFKRLAQFLLIILLFFINNCFQKKTYTIGVITNLEGKNSKVGIDAVKSIKIAYDIFLQEKKPDFEIDFLLVDNQFDAELTKKAYNEIKDKTKIMIFGTTTTSFLPTYEHLKNDQNILAFASVVSDKIRNIDDNVIKLLLDVEDEQKQVAEFINQNNFGDMVILKENNINPKYSDSALLYFTKYYNKYFEIINFDGNNMNIEEIINNKSIKSKKYIYIISGTLSRELAIIIQSIHKNMPDKIFITLPWGNDDIFLKNLGNSYKNVIFSNMVNTIDNQNPEYNKFVKTFSSKEGYEPKGIFNFVLYDTTMIILNALNKIKTDNPEKIKKFIINNKFNYSLGNINFNKYGDLEAKIYFYRYDLNENKFKVF